MEQEILFEETQGFDQPLFTISVWLGPIILGLVIFYELIKGTFDLGSSDGLSLFLVFIAVILLSFALQSLKLRTKVFHDRIVLRFSILAKKEIRIKDITLAESVVYNPIKDYGGWGLRWGNKGKAYNVKGNKGIKFLINQKEKFLLGTQHPEKLAEVLDGLFVPSSVNNGF